jgi:hypothetical protein
MHQNILERRQYVKLGNDLSLVYLVCGFIFFLFLSETKETKYTRKTR